MCGAGGHGGGEMETSLLEQQHTQKKENRTTKIKNSILNFVFNIKRRMISIFIEIKWILIM